MTPGRALALAALLGALLVAAPARAADDAPALASEMALAHAVALASDVAQDIANDAADAAALDLADATPATPAKTARPWKLDIQDALRLSGYRGADEGGSNQWTAEFAYDQWLTPTFGAHFAARYDRYDPLWTSTTTVRDIPLVKEAYASWRASPSFALDAGRINERIGAGVGYNPTDFFRVGAVSLNVPPDPDSRHANRLGAVGLRAQQVWDTGSATLFLSPRLTAYSPPGNPAATSDLQRTNGVDRWLLVTSQRLTQDIQPQWVLYGQRGQPVQVGQNLSVLVNDALVAYLEWAGGYRPSLIGYASGSDPSRAFRASSALGLTWTLPIDLTLTAELQNSASGANAAQWRGLQTSNPGAWGQAVQTTVSAQELQTRYGLFLMATWRNVAIQRLDLSAFVQADMGGGRQYWLELRRRWDHFDLALQLERQTGPSWSRFGAQPEAGSVQILGIWYW